MRVRNEARELPYMRSFPAARVAVPLTGKERRDQSTIPSARDKVERPLNARMAKATHRILDHQAQLVRAAGSNLAIPTNFWRSTLRQQWLF